MAHGVGRVYADYIPGAKNVVVDALSRLIIDKSLVVEDDLFVEECLDLSQDLRDFDIPVNFCQIYKEQLKDPMIKQLQCKTPDCLDIWFEDVG